MKRSRHATQPESVDQTALVRAVRDHLLTLGDFGHLRVYHHGPFIVIAQPGPPDDPEDDDPVMRLTPIGASQFGASFCAPAGNWEKLPVSGTLQAVLVKATTMLGPWLDADPIIDAT
jgi:hypothetical protein